MQLAQLGDRDLDPTAGGIGELLVVLVIILVVFGAGRLPEVMGSLGKGMQAFKKGLREPPEIDVTPENPPPDAKAKPEA